MLDENLPTFRLKASSDDPSTSILFLTQNGSDPSPEYLFRRADPTTQPASRNKYAAALCSAYAGADVVYAEVVVEPEWTQPSLSAAEIRNAGGTTPAPVPVVPDSFAVQLYDPDQTVTFKTLTSTWTKSDSWEFEMPTQSFRLPSSSALDREREDARTSPDGTTAVAASLVVPRIVFRWKRDGRLSKDMTCYLVGKNLGGGKKSKEPDITVALFKAGKDSAITIYEPNLQRVEVEDRKGLEVVLLLGAEVIRDLYLVPRQDVFNVSGGSANGGRRKNSRPSPSPPATMSGALGSATIPPQHGTAAHTARPPPPGGPSPGPNAGADIDAETRRLQAMVAQEEREREKREKAEQKRIKRMLEEEEKERRRREAEVAKETERLKKLYGVQGQDLPSSTPQLPPRRPQQSPAGALYPPPPGAGGWYGPGAPPPHLPPRPVSVGPLPQHGPGPFASGASTSWWRGPGAAGPPPPQQQMGGRTQRRGSGGGGPGLGILNPAAASSGFFSGGREDKEKRKVQKKRSMHW